MDITIDNAKEILKKYLKNNKERLYHSIRVAKIAKILAQKNNEAVEDAVIAALLHDIGKSMTQSELLSLCASNETLMYDFEIFQLPNALHGKAGAIIFEKEFDRNSNPEKFDRIKQAIAYHVAGGEEKMTKLDKIIYIADSIEPEKENRYNSNDKKSLLTKINKGELVDIDEIVKLIIQEKKKRAQENGRECNPLIDNILEL